MTAVVYHAPEDALFCRDEEAIAARFRAGEYEKVATVATDSLNEAYDLTNSGSYHWDENPGVVAMPGRQRRSTAVGDVVEVLGRLYIVAPSGWSDLPG